MIFGDTCMTIGPTSYDPTVQVNPLSELPEIEVTGDPAVDEAVVELQAALSQFQLHGNPFVVVVAEATIKVESTLAASSLSVEQRDQVMSQLKASILDSGLPNLEQPTVANEADNLFGHLVPDTLLDFPGLNQLVSTTQDSPLLQLVHQADTAGEQLEQARAELLKTPDNDAAKDRFQKAMSNYLEKLGELHAELVGQHKDSSEKIGGAPGLEAALAEVSTLLNV